VSAGTGSSGRSSSRWEEQAEGRPPDERRAHRGKAAARRLPRPVAVEHPRAGRARAWTALDERAQDRDRAGLRHGVGIRDEDELVLRARRTEVRVRRERERLVVLQHAYVLRQPAWNASRNVRDHDELVDLRRERRQRLLELRGVPVRDDDGADLHASTAR